MMKQYATIDEYISTFPKGTQLILKKLRQITKEITPNSKEAIKYGIPTLVLNGNLLHFAAYKTHIGFYPTSAAIRVFKKELSKYETAKGTIRFSLEKPLPVNLIKKIVKFRVQENLNKKTK